MVTVTLHCDERCTAAEKGAARPLSPSMCRFFAARCPSSMSLEQLSTPATVNVAVSHVQLLTLL